MNNLMVERFNVAGAMVAKIFGDPPRELELFRKEAKRVRDVNLSLATYARILFIGLSLMGGLAVCFVYGWGGVRAADGLMDLGTVVALVSYLIRLYGPLASLSNLQVDYMTTIVSFERVFEVLDLTPMVAEPKPGRPLPKEPIRLEFNSVDFRYPVASEVSLASLEAVPMLSNSKERSVLHDVSFVAEPGQCVALVGPSGAGKTTLAQLALRFYDPIRGTVSMNGVDLREAQGPSLQATIGMVTQDAHLFHDTVRNNLLFAKPTATDGEIRAALEAAQILQLVESLPEGLETVLGDRGHRLSGGEKARVAIARMLLKAPPFVILDEATAHLDSESERLIQAAFQTALKGRTSLVIAHRLSTVQHADLILVLEKGRIVERGRHEALVNAGGVYGQLHRAFLAGPAAAPAV
jgi:ATP-binding cassette subfamily B protein